MTEEYVSTELIEMLHDLGILSREELSAAIFEAQQQSLSIWKHLKQTNRLSQKQSDTLDMCQKGYIPVKVAKITLGMNQQAPPKNETKTVPANTDQTVESKIKEPANQQKKSPQSSATLTPKPLIDTKNPARDFSSYLNTPAKKSAPEVETVVEALEPSAQIEQPTTPPVAEQNKPAKKDSDWPTKNARVVLDENATDEEELEYADDSIAFKLNPMRTPPPLKSPPQRNPAETDYGSFQETTHQDATHQDTTHQGKSKQSAFNNLSTSPLSYGDNSDDMRKFFPNRQNRSSHEHAPQTSNTTRGSDKKQRTDLSYLVGRKISKFQLSTQLGKGSAGTVFLAHHAALNMPVAIKILDPNLAKHYPELINRFMQEASSAARINHPNVIRVLDCDFVEGLYIIVMEYVDGISLSELIQMNGALSEDRGLKYILSVAEGLEAAYQVGIVHRDIKPANILITKTKQVRIADMGLARAIKDNNISDTAHGVGLGTPQYFPPEQARDAASVDHRSDIYALGITLYVVLCGELPFKAKSLSELVRQHENEYAIPLNVVNPGITQRTTNLVITMMQKHPDDRYQTYEALIQAIQSCIVECQTRSDDMGSGTSRSSFSVLDRLGNLFNRKT
ncbi:MAG: protein kinase [Sumerlaeia bacterium]